ncbi:hypothetical protein N9A28_06800 [Sulfurimonas sp.]|nr:hypothetical protein [Sulfurimonas sp.]
MVKKIVLTLTLMASFVSADVYQENCVECHKTLRVSIDKYFYKYLLMYSGERDIKYAMINYLQYPAYETSVMSDEFISKYGIKQKSRLSKQEIEEAVDTYWEKYKVFGKLK